MDQQGCKITATQKNPLQVKLDRLVKRTVLLILIHPTGVFVGKSTSVRVHLSGSAELVLRQTNQFKSVLIDPLGFQVLLEIGAKL